MSSNTHAQTIKCPICGDFVGNSELNDHVDECAAETDRQYTREITYKLDMKRKSRKGATDTCRHTSLEPHWGKRSFDSNTRKVQTMTGRFSHGDS